MVYLCTGESMITIEFTEDDLKAVLAVCMQRILGTHVKISYNTLHEATAKMMGLGQQGTGGLEDRLI